MHIKLSCPSVSAFYTKSTHIKYHFAFLPSHLGFNHNMIWNSAVTLITLSALLIQSTDCKALWGPSQAPQPHEPSCEIAFKRHFGPPYWGRHNYKVTMSLPPPSNPDGLHKGMCSEALRKSIQDGCSEDNVQLPEDGAPKMKGGNCVFTVMMFGTHGLVNPGYDPESPPSCARRVMECYAQASQPPFDYPKECVCSNLLHLSSCLTLTTI